MSVIFPLLQLLENSWLRGFCIVSLVALGASALIKSGK